MLASLSVWCTELHFTAAVVYKDCNLQVKFSSRTEEADTILNSYVQDWPIVNYTEADKNYFRNEKDEH